MSTNLTPWNGLDVEKLKVWVHRILPLVYDDSLSYYEVLAKVGAKMNEVIEGLNANNEQIEKVTGFTIEQVQNLTLAFNNFQQSMLARQENFETKVLDSQHSFETQLKGDIANWEATTEEKFRQQYEKDSTALNNAYDKFLADYQRQFGVVQDFGDSEENVLSQKAITDWAFIVQKTVGYSENCNLNDFTKNGVYLISSSSETAQRLNFPEYINNNEFCLLFVYTDNVSYCAQFLYESTSKVSSYRLGLPEFTNAEWSFLNATTVDEFGNNKYNAISQNAVSKWGFIIKKSVGSSDDADLNQFTENGVYLIASKSDSATRDNFPEFVGENNFVILFVYTDGSSYVAQFLYEDTSGITAYRLGVPILDKNQWKFLNAKTVDEFGDSKYNAISQKAITDWAFIVQKTVGYSENCNLNDFTKNGVYLISSPSETAQRLNFPKFVNKNEFMIVWVFTDNASYRYYVIYDGCGLYGGLTIDLNAIPKSYNCFSYTPMNNKKWVAYGTSLTAGQPNSYVTYASAFLNCEVENKGKGGASVGPSGDSYIYNTVLNTASTLDNPKLITIEVLPNDDDSTFGEPYTDDEETFLGRIALMCKALITANPESQVAIIASWCGRRSLEEVPFTPSTKAFGDLTWGEAIEKLRQQCEAIGVPFIRVPLMSIYSGDELYLDNIHPTEYGAKIVGKYIAKEIQQLIA